jgi:hypothetical protein
MDFLLILPCQIIGSNLRSPIPVIKKLFLWRVQPYPSQWQKSEILESRPVFWWIVTLLVVIVLKMLKICSYGLGVLTIKLFFYPLTYAEYTQENPKIMTKCTHHFHLGCIYEWMERSDSCPVCGKVTCFALFCLNLLIQFAIFILELY